MRLISTRKADSRHFWAVDHPSLSKSKVSTEADTYMPRDAP